MEQFMIWGYNNKIKNYKLYIDYMGNISYSKRLKKKLMDIHSLDKELPKLIESEDIKD
jgi:hypothetical protein